jgi:mRNA interferase HigB
MQLFGKRRLETFMHDHADSCIPLAAWQLEAEEAVWTTPEEVQQRYLDALVQPNRLVFTVKNMYRIDVKAKFKQGILMVERVWINTVARQGSVAANDAAPRSKA